MDDVYPEHEKANISMDLFINSSLIAEGFTLPKDGCFPEKMGTKAYPNGMPPLKSSMWYYKELSKEQEEIEKEKNSSGSPSSSGDGDGNDNSEQQEQKDYDDMTPRERTKNMLDNIKNSKVAHKWDIDDQGLSDIEKKVISQSIQDATINIAQEISNSSTPGNLPGHIKDLIEKLNKITVPAEDWKKLLKNQIGSYPTRNKKLTRKKPSKRFKGSPGVKRTKVNKLLVGVDTSGSMDQKDIAEAFAEIHHIYKAGGKIDVAEIDTQIHEIKEYAGKVPEYITGRGGTNLTPILEYFKENINKYSVCVILTDGFHERPTIEVAKPVIHLVTTNGSNDKFEDMPYRTIKMKNDLS